MADEINNNKTDKEKESLKDKILYILCLLLCGGFLITAFIAFFGGAIKDWNTFRAEIDRIEDEQLKISTRKVSLASINYASEIEGNIRGSFFIGYGSISENQYYVAYEILDDKGKKLFKMPAEITVIYDMLAKDAQAYAEVDENYYGMVGVRLYVPTGTITQEYDLSLE